MLELFLIRPQLPHMVPKGPELASQQTLPLFKGSFYCRFQKANSLKYSQVPLFLAKSFQTSFFASLFAEFQAGCQFYTVTQTGLFQALQFYEANEESHPL